jgi:hypothetical protein
LGSVQVYSNGIRQGGKEIAGLLSALTKTQPESTPKAEKLRPENPFSIMTVAALKNAAKPEESEDKSNKKPASGNKVIRGPWTAAVLSGKVNIAAETAAAANASTAAKRELNDEKKSKQKVEHLTTAPAGGWTAQFAKKSIDANQKYKDESKKAADLNQEAFEKGLSKTGNSLVDAQKEQEHIQQIQARNSLDRQTAQNSGHSWASYVLSRRQIAQHGHNHQ